MGFFKRLFSFGSNKSKKRQPTFEELAPSAPTPSVDEEQQRRLEEEEHEAAVGRLLRSSSSRYAVVKEIDYTELPPLREVYLFHIISSFTEFSVFSSSDQ